MWLWSSVVGASVTQQHHKSWKSHQFCWTLSTGHFIFFNDADVWSGQHTKKDCWVAEEYDIICHRLCTMNLSRREYNWFSNGFARLPPSFTEGVLRVHSQRRGTSNMLNGMSIHFPRKRTAFRLEGLCGPKRPNHVSIAEPYHYQTTSKLCLKSGPWCSKCLSGYD